MPNRLELPDEIQHLIEKRQQERRNMDGANDPGGAESKLPAGEERRKQERRSDDRT